MWLNNDLCVVSEFILNSMVLIKYHSLVYVNRQVYYRIKESRKFEKPVKLLTFLSYVQSSWFSALLLRITLLGYLMLPINKIQENQQYEIRIFVYISLTFIAVALLLHLEETNSKPSTHKSLKTHDVLTRIGFSKIRAPNSHHKKRLAVESRQHTRSDDSHMYVIKLPPNQHYYVHNRPNSFAPELSKNLPVGFKNNGRPAKIYHWNIPVLKKFTKGNSLQHKARLNNKVINFKSPENWNDVLDKPEKTKKSKKDNKLINHRKQSFYVPTKPKKSSFFKYFPGNGKPKSFYVIDKSKKKAHYHRLLP